MRCLRIPLAFVIICLGVVACKPSTSSPPAVDPQRQAEKTSFRTKRKAQAAVCLDELQMMNAAIYKWVLDYEKPDGTPLGWADIKQYIKYDSRLMAYEGKDLFGRPYTLREVGIPPKISAETVKDLSDAVSLEYWSPYYP